MDIMIEFKVLKLYFEPTQFEKENYMDVRND